MESAGQTCSATENLPMPGSSVIKKGGEEYDGTGEKQIAGPLGGQGAKSPKDK